MTAPVLDAPGSLGTRLVTIDARDSFDTAPPPGLFVRFTLRDDVDVPADGVTMRAGSLLVPLVDGLGQVTLPVYDPTKAPGRWWIEVDKSWTRDTYGVQIPAGTTTIPLAKLAPLQRTTSIARTPAAGIAGVSVQWLPTGDAAYGSISGSVLSLGLPEPEGKPGPPGPSLPDGGLTMAMVSPEVDAAYRRGRSVDEFRQPDDTDDTDAFERAFAAVGNGGSLYARRRDYTISRPLTVPAGLTLYGESTYQGGVASTGTMLRFTATSGTLLTLASGAALRGITLYGPGPATATTGFAATSAYRMSDVAVMNFGDAMSLSQVWYGAMTDCLIDLNARAGTIDYCYNLSWYNVKTHCRKDSNYTPGDGYSLTGETMMTMHGGSIEGYRAYATRLTGGITLTMLGVYMETKHGTAGVPIGIDMTAMTDGTVTLTGCQVYQTNHRSWVEASATTGGTLVSSGNTLKGGRPGDNSLVYRIPVNTADLRICVGPDNSRMPADSSGGLRYMSTTLPANSVVIPPVGGNLKEGITVTGPVHLAGYTTLPSGAGLQPGSMMWDATRKKVAIWSGAGWLDATGGALI